jgi:hypothetical protein
MLLGEYLIFFALVLDQTTNLSSESRAEASV